MRPRALRSPGGWETCMEPSRSCSILSPTLARAFGSLARAGRYSFRMIEGGTFQVGLIVMYFIVSASRGVAYSPGLPTTIRVDHAVRPRLITLSVYTGKLPTIYVAPRSCGSTHHPC